MPQDLFNYHNRNNPRDVFNMEDPCGLNAPSSTLSADVQSISVKPGAPRLYVGDKIEKYDTHLMLPPKSLAIDIPERKVKRNKVVGRSMVLDIDGDYDDEDVEEERNVYKRPTHSEWGKRKGVKVLGFNRSKLAQSVEDERLRLRQSRLGTLGGK